MNTTHLTAIGAIVVIASTSFASEEKILHDVDFAKAKLLPIKERDREDWRRKGWDVRSRQWPKSFQPQGSNGMIDVQGSGPNRCLHFRGSLRGPTLSVKGLNALVFQVKMLSGRIKCYGRHYGGPKGGQLGHGHYFEAVGNAQWQTYTWLYQFERKDVGAAVLMFFSKEGAQLGAVRVLGFTDVVAAWEKTYALYRQPAVNLLANGCYEKTKAMEPAQAREFREQLGWQLGPAKKVVLPEKCEPHSYWKGKRLVLVDDPAKARSGRRCVEFTLFRGEGFTVKPDRSYVVSLWLRGKGQFSLFAAAYGGPKGGFLGNLPIVGESDKWTLGPTWRRHETTVQFRIEGHDRLGLAPVFVASGGIGYVDDVCIVEIESKKSLHEKVRRARLRIEEVLDLQIDLTAEERQAVDSFIGEAQALERELANPDAASDLAALAHRVAGLHYVVTLAKKEILFGD